MTPAPRWQAVGKALSQARGSARSGLVVRLDATIAPGTSTDARSHHA